MSLISMHLIIFFAVTGVLAGVPFSYGMKFENEQVVREVLTTSEKEKIGDIALSKSDRGGSLSLKNLGNVLEKIKERGQTISFKEVGMKFGEKDLSANDLLVSPGQDGKYYLAKFIGKFHEYQLSNGKFVRTFNKHDPVYKELDYVVLDWKPFYSSRLSLSKITVGSCEFTRLNESILRIRCQEFFNGKNGFGEMVQGLLTFKEKDKEVKDK